jgi:hypothetical protein
VKENEYKVIMEDVSLRPKTKSIESKSVTRNAGTDSSRVERTVNTREIPNPKLELLPAIDQKIVALRQEKGKKDNELLALRPVVEAALKEHTGFLDELDLMISIMSKSVVAVITWLIWFFLLLGLELFILVSKWKEPETDYDEVIKQQMEIHLKRLRLLGEQ